VSNIDPCTGALVAQTPHGIFGTDHHTRAQVHSRCSVGTGGDRRSWQAVEVLLAYHVQQTLKKGTGGVTKNLGLPERVISLPRECGNPGLQKFFDECTPAERVLFSTFLFTGFREQEGVHSFWADFNFPLNTIRVTSKPELGSWPKRWEEREVPVPKALIELLQNHARRENCRFIFPSPAGNREWHILDRCKDSEASRTGYNEVGP
jgi:hypothetical protein